MQCVNHFFRSLKHMITIELIHIPFLHDGGMIFTSQLLQLLISNPTLHLVKSHLLQIH